MMSSCDFIDCDFRTQNDSCTLQECIIDPETLLLWKESNYERQQRVLTDLLDMRKERVKEEE